MKKVGEIMENILRITPAELENHGVLKPALNGGYVCPACNNGEGDDGTGIKITDMGSHYAARCFKCGEKFNNFHFLAAHYHLDRKDDFVEIIKRATEEFHLENFVPEKIIQSEKKSTAEVELIHSDISNAEKTLNNFIENQGGKVRGLNLKILQKFHCGYLQNWVHPKNRFENKKVSSSRRLIIPTANHYNAVLIQADRTEQNKKWWKMHAGSKEVFGLDLVPADVEFLIVVEGETDAMSIIQATDEKFFAIATGGAAEKNFIEELNQKFSEHKPKILILFDPDEAGRKNAPKICKLLEKNNFPTTFKFLSKEICKLDANQILQERGDAKLGEIISLIVDDAQKDFKKIPAEKSIPNNEKIPQPYTTRNIIPNCPVDFYLPYNFGFSKDGITRNSKKEETIKVTHRPVVITRRFIEPNSYQHKYEIAFLNYDNVWIKKIVDVDILADQRKIIQLAKYGIGFTSAEAKYLAQFLNDFIYAGDNAQKMSTIDAFNQPGWNDDFTKFIYPTGNENYICHRNGFEYEKLFKAKGSKEKWLEMFKKVSDKGGATARIVIGAAMAASLVKPLSLPNIQIHIHGKRGIGKSPLPKFAVSAFGDPRTGRLTRTFAGTMKNKLETAAAFNDLPMVLDELETVGSKQDEAKLSSMIYDYSLGVANQANKRDGTSRAPVEFSGCRISTGERPLVKSTDKGGAFKRVLDINIQSLFEDDFASELHSFSENNYGLFGKDWTEKFILENLDSMRTDFNVALRLSRETGVFNKNEFSKIDVEPTQLKSIIVCAVAYKYFAKFLGIKISEEQFYSDIAEIVLKLPTTKEIDDTHRAKEALASFVAGHKKYFVSEIKNPADCLETDAVAFETYGKIFNNGEVAFLPHKLKQILENELGFASAEKLISEWADEGKLRRQGNGFTYKTRLNNHAQWTYRFKENVLIGSYALSEEETY